jgi:hypothetical protein
MQVNTGYGYIKDKDGNIVSKYELPIGEHPSTIGYTYYEVADAKALNAVETYVASQTDDEKLATLIADKQKELAIAELKKDGKLNQDGSLKK